MFDLRAAMAALPVPDTQGLQPPHWEYWRNQLWHLAQTKPAATFCAWPCVYHTMLQNHWPKVIYAEVAEMQAIIGKLPADYSAPVEQANNHSQEQNNLRQMYHLFKWEQVTGRRIADLESIVEIGGGYGALCLMAKRMGFRGKYTIYDLPEFSALQQWYLDAAGVEGVTFATGKPPRFFSKNQKYFDLHIGIYSLSEMPMDARDEVLFGFPAWSYLYLLSGKWETYDNVDYFQNRISFEKIQWHHEELTHIPDRNNWYAIGYGSLG